MVGESLEYWKAHVPFAMEDRVKTEERERKELNVLGDDLQPCSFDPLTGFFRDGCCRTGPQDFGRHTVCALVTEEFLAFSKSRGNDLSTPRPEFNFSGLKPGDRWCLCASRWKEAFENNVAPQVILGATHHSVLELVSLSDLQEFALDLI